MKSYCANNCHILYSLKEKKMHGLLIAIICFSFNLSYMAFIDTNENDLCLAIDKFFTISGVEKVVCI